MNHAVKKIRDNISGDISVKPEDIEYYSTDGSVFELTPTAIVYPKDVIDVVNLVRTINDINSRGGDTVSITARGNGTDQGGGPINTGIIVDFMRHMDHILEIGDDYVIAEPGVIYGKLQAELKRRGRYIPSYPASVEISTIGGAVANNAAGEKTVKYGSTRRYVEAVQVVMANGKQTWLHSMQGNELEDKLRYHGLEGEIYRQIVDMLQRNESTIFNDHPHTTKESAGYALWEVARGGAIDLSQLVTGSQGTLCMITAVKLATVELPDPSNVSLMVSYYESVEKAGLAAMELHELRPSALEIVDSNLISLVNKQKPELLKGLLPEDGHIPAVVLLTEIDDKDDLMREGKERKAKAIIDQHAYSSVLKHDPEEEANLWKLRRSAAAVMWTIPGKKKALPIIEDGTVPADKLVEFLRRAYEIFDKHKLEIAVWGHAGDADLHMQPFMDLSKVEDRKKVFKVTDDFYKMVHELGGTAAGEHNDSLMRAPYRPLMFGEKMEELFNEVKSIFDPQNIFNPQKKVGVDFNYIKQHLRHEYSIKSIAHLEREKAQQTIDR